MRKKKKYKVTLTEEELIKALRSSIFNILSEEPTDDKDSISYKVKQLINEEFGIAREVSEIVSIIKRKLEDEMVRQDNNPCTGEFNTIVHNGKVTVRYRIYDLPDRKTFEEWCENNSFNGSFSGDKQALSLVIGSVGKKLQPESLSTIQHELEHCYESYRRDRKGTLSPKYSVLKTKVTGDIINDERVRELYPEEFRNAYIQGRGKITGEQDKKNLEFLDNTLYYCFNNEITANINGFDAYVTYTEGVPDWNFEKLPLYKTMDNIEKILTDWDKDYKGLVQNAYQVDNYVIYNLLRNAWGKYARGIARVLAKHKFNGDGYMGRNRNWFGIWKNMLDKAGWRVALKSLQNQKKG